MQRMEDWSKAAGITFDAFSTMYEAEKNKELSIAGLTDKEKAKIEQKYAKRQQAIAGAQALIEGILEIARTNSNTGVNSDLTQTLRAILTGAAVLKTATNIAVIESQQFAGGKYPDLEGSGSASAMQITALLQANLSMMRQVILSHERP